MQIVSLGNSHFHSDSLFCCKPLVIKVTWPYVTWLRQPIDFWQKSGDRFSQQPAVKQILRDIKSWIIFQSSFVHSDEEVQHNNYSNLPYST